MRLAKLATIFLVFLFMTAAVARAQTASGEVNGTVMDRSGAAVSDATVKLINQETQITNEIHTNSNGYFVFINVQPGPYELTVQKPGFKVANVTTFNVDVNQTLSQNLHLELGAVNDVVTVTTEAPLLQSSSSELVTVI